MDIMNSRPLVDVSTDPNSPVMLTPTILLTQKFERTSAPDGDFEKKSYTAKDHWKQVQGLEDIFAKMWKQEYLSLVTLRQKWTNETPNIKIGDIVLLK
eukprot:gene9703-10689_t